MLFSKTVAIPCPADLHCFAGTDYDELIGHLSLTRNREPLIAYEPSEFLSVFHGLRDPRTRECYSVLSCRQLTHDHCSCFIPLKASKQLQHLLAVLGSSKRPGKGCTLLLALLENKAGDKKAFYYCYYYRR